MDTTKLTDDILNEWAMRSPDGLAAGHNTPENAAILQEILGERGFTNEELKFDPAKINPLDSQYFRAPAKGMEKLTLYHPIYVDGQTIDSVKDGTAVTRDEEDRPLNTTNSPKPLKSQESVGFTVDGIVSEKKFPPHIAQLIMQSAVDNLSSAVYKKFAREEYNTYTSVNKAIGFVNTGNSSKEYRAFFEDLDEIVRSKFRTSVGRGEIILTLMLKGAKTRGQKSGDIELSDGLVVDVKEMDTGGSGLFRVPLTVFGGTGNFYKLRFPHAINQLFSFCAANKEAQDTLIKIIQYDVEIKKTDYFYLMRFFHDLSWDTIGVRALAGLASIMAYIQDLPPGKLEKLGLGDRVEFDVGGEEHVMTLNKIDPSEKQKIQNPKTEKEPITVSVSAITDKHADILMPQIKALEIFREPDSEEEVFMPRQIGADMLANMEHYTGGIIFCEREDDEAKVGNYYYEPDLKNLRRPFEFYNYGQEAVGFKRIK